MATERHLLRFEKAMLDDKPVDLEAEDPHRGVSLSFNTDGYNYELTIPHNELVQLIAFLETIARRHDPWPGR